jgi:hypothetical protein
VVEGEAGIGKGRLLEAGLESARAAGVAIIAPELVVLAGTVLGRVGHPAHGPGRIVFQIRPAGARAPIDPGPIVAGWQLRGRLTAGRSSIAGAVQAGAYGSANPWVGQLLMAPRADLERAVLADPRVTLDACGRRSIRAEFEPVDSTALSTLPHALNAAQWKRLIRHLVRLGGA